jgi:DNA-binding transcriptional LysR family regulator
MGRARGGDQTVLDSSGARFVCPKLFQLFDRPPKHRFLYQMNASNQVGSTQEDRDCPRRAIESSSRSRLVAAHVQHLVDSTRASFAEIERNFAGVKDLASGLRGLLRVTVPVALGRQRIVPPVPEFLRLHPEVRIELELSDRLSSLAKEGFDLAVRHVAVVPDTHVAWKLCDTRSVLVASRAYLRKRGAPLRPEQLGKHNCLHYLRDGVAPTWAFEPSRGGGQRIIVKISGMFAANNSEVLREAALAGVGIALVPDFSAQTEIAAGRLRPVLADWRVVGAFGETLFAIRPYAPQVPRAVEALVSFLRRRLAGGFAAPSSAA